MIKPLWKTVWQFLTKLNILLPYNPATALLCIYPKELKTCPHKNMHMDVYSSFTHNCQNLDTTKLFFSKWMINKLWYIQTMEYYSVVRRSELLSHKKTWRRGPSMHFAKWKKPIWEGYCLIPTTGHSGKGKTMETVNRWMVTRVMERGGKNRWSTGDFKGNETILYDPVMVDTCHYTFVKTHRMYTKSELVCKLQTLVNNNLSLLAQLSQMNHTNTRC